MRSKYLLKKMDNQLIALGIRYDDVRKELLIGGSFRWNDDIWGVVEMFVPDIHCRQGVSDKVEINRMRVTVGCFGVLAWCKGLARLREYWEMEKVRGFRRLMT
jgi:hypothetical protein